jgi:hypothetical protein
LRHEQAWRRLPNLLEDRDEPELLAHVSACNDCQRQLFLLGRVDRLLREEARHGSRELRRAPGRRSRRIVSRVGAASAVGAAAVVVLLLLFPQGRRPHQFTLRTAAGRPVGEAVLARADAVNMSLSLVARGLPTRRGDVYLLWAGGDGRPATTVGRFMVDPRGACRAKFNLMGGRRWARFWITPPGAPHAVVATT